MKRLLAFMLAGLMVLSTGSLNFTASADEVQTVSESQVTPAEDFIYEVGDDSVTITGYRGEEETIVIPDTIEGKKVTAIADSAFEHRGIKNVTLPETLVTIGYAAFCDTLVTEVTIPKSVKNIKDYAFGAYEQRILTYPENGTDCCVDYAYGDFAMYGYVGTAADDYALKHAKVHFIPLDYKDASAEYFDYEENNDGGITITKIHTDNLPEVLVIPEKINGKTVTEIAENASGLNPGEYDYNEVRNYNSYDEFGFTPITVVLNEGLERIGNGAFGSVYAKKVYLPGSVEYVSEDSFCLQLADNFIYEGGDGESQNFSGWFTYPLTLRITGINGVTYNVMRLRYYADWDLIDYYGADEGLTDDGFKYTVDNEGYVTIMSYKGEDKEVFVHNYIDARTVTEIGEEAFKKSDITEISLPYYLHIISYNAFLGCKNLKSVNFRTDEYGFSFVEEIRNWAFEGCKNLKSITIPSGIVNIGEYCGLGTAKIEFISDHSDSDVEMNYGMLGPCAECERHFSHKIDWQDTDEQESPDEPLKLVQTYRYDLYMFPFTVYGTRGTAAQDYANKYDTVTFVPLDEDNLPDDYNDLKYKVDDYGKVIITGAKETADEIVIPTIIPMDNFYFGTREVTAVADNAFKDNKNIKSVTFDKYIYFNGRMEGVKTIGNYAFAGCDNLQNVDFTTGDANPIVTSIGECAFLDCKSLKSITIPASVDKIGDYAFGFITNGEKKELVPDFVIYGYTGTAAEEYANKYGVKFESIGYKGFEYKTVGSVIELTAYRGLEIYLDIPETLDNAPVRVIGENAFAKNTILYSVYIPDSVMYIKDEAFRGCEQLDNIHFASFRNLVHIGNYAFAECSNLKVVEIPNSIKYIGENAFGFSCYIPVNYNEDLVADAETKYNVTLYSPCFNPVLNAYKENNANITYYSDEIIHNGVDIHDWVNGLKDPESDLWNPEYSIVLNDEIPDHAVYDEGHTNDGGYTIIDDELYISDEFYQYVYHVPVTEIGESAFNEIPDLGYKTVAIGNNIKTIKTDTFADCESIKEFYIPAGVEKIEDYAIGYYVVAPEATPDSPAHIHSKINDVVIYGYENTEAQRYAEENDIKFYNLGNSDVDYNYQKYETPDVPYKKGDVNGDNKVTAKDSLIIQRYAIGLEKLDDKSLAAADVNGDGRVTTKDALEILRHTIGKTNIFYPSYSE